MSALAVQAVSVRFGALAALTDVSFQVEPGERRAIIGPNGAGKTTLFNVISGELAPTAGRIALAGADVTQAPPQARARAGMCRTFQRNNLFPQLSVRDNVRLAVQIRRRPWDLRLTPARAQAPVEEETDALLAEHALADVAAQAVQTLSYGIQRQLEIALALAGHPRVLLLDEPTAGMSPAETSQIVALLDKLPRTLTLLIIEHDMDVVAAVADRIAVLHHGEVVADGEAAAVRGDAGVRAIYLGVEEDA